MNANKVRELLFDTLVFAGAVEEMEKQAIMAQVHDLRQLDLDSLAMMELCIGVEAGTGVALTPEDIADNPSVDALIELVLANR